MSDATIAAAIAATSEALIRLQDAHAALMARLTAPAEETRNWHISRAKKALRLAEPLTVKALAKLEAHCTDKLASALTRPLIVDGPMASQHPTALDYTPEPDDAA